jgi:hypothetical protein
MPDIIASFAPGSARSDEKLQLTPGGCDGKLSGHAATDGAFRRHRPRNHLLAHAVLSGVRF